MLTIGKTTYDAEPIADGVRLRKSDGKTYTVRHDVHGWHCTCPARAFGHGRECKHLRAIREGNMVQAIARYEDAALALDNQVDLIKRTICKGATDDELKLFMLQCKRTGLDPFSRQIHAVKRWDSTAGREVMAIQTGIDGYRLVADRTGKYAGSDDPTYDTETQEHPNKATVTVWKLVGNLRVAFTRSARWAEFRQTKKDGSLTKFWKQMPYLMLGKVAEALALRAAFPQELSGIYTHEEMGQADIEDVRTVEPAVRQIPASPATITPEQAAELSTLVAERTGNLGKLLEWAHVGCLADLPAEKYVAVKAAILKAPLKSTNGAAPGKPALATKSQIADITRYRDEAGWSEDALAKWYAGENIDPATMTREQADQACGFLLSEIAAQQPA